MEDKITEIEEALEEQGLDEEKRNDLETKLKQPKKLRISQVIIPS